MQSKHFVKRLIIVGTIFLITLGFVIPSSVLSAPPTPDPEDGIWSDSFDDPNTVDTDNCHVLNGTIVLEQSTNGRLYDFRESNHKAYSWVTNRISILLMQIGFFSPDSHIKLEYEFGRFTQRPKIKKQDNDYAERSSGLANKCVVHHFRFKLDVDADSIGNIEVYWYGKGQNHQSIDLYLWKLVREDGIYGTWEYLKSIHTGPELYYNISQEKAKLAVSEENYLDICIIASPSELSDCTLFTDYIKIVSQTEKGYEIGYGTARSKIWVEPKEYSEDADNFYWDILTWRDYERGGATVKYHVLYENETNYEKLVEDEYFSEGENSKGFTDPPICLNAIPHSKLKIMANLSTDTSRVSPKIFSWTLTWQKDPNRWQDLFNSEHRMDLKNKINVSDGKVTIKPISGNWPMLGHDPQNTRRF